MPGYQYLLRRLLHLAITQLVVITLIFGLFRLLPGDPASAMVDPLAPPESRQLLLKHLGLDRPLHVQYFTYLRNFVRGELGVSFRYNRPVVSVLWGKVLNTLILTLAAFVFAYTLGIIGGIILAWNHGTKVDTVGSILVLVFRSAPIFWSGIMAIMLFSFWLDWLPHAGMRTPGYEATGLLETYVSMDFVRHLILPVLISGLYYIGLPLLLMRNTMLDVLGEEFIEMARAKGMGPIRLMFRHAARNALLPVITAGALFIGWAMGGQVLVEYLFSWPGLGREIVLAVENRDYPMAQGAFLFISLMVMTLNLLADVVYSWLDPRIALR
ncbi:MAG: ABC transporter permease [Nitrospinota bacterium]|nr:ABC transporter permease [Nitrospinota bacterium]